VNDERMKAIEEAAAALNMSVEQMAQAFEAAPNPITMNAIQAICDVFAPLAAQGFEDDMRRHALEQQSIRSKLRAADMKRRARG
jgi:hypothetical protein